MSTRAARSRRRQQVALLWRVVLVACASVALLTLGGIFVILLDHAARAFSDAGSLGVLTDAERALLSPAEVADLERVTAASAAPTLLGDFLGAVVWVPDAASGKARYGVWAMAASTAMTTVIAMLLAVPVGVGAAGWLAFRAPPRVRELVKTSLELLAAIPSVVLGFVGIVVLGPLLVGLGAPSGLSALNGGILLAIMALPTIISISEDALTSVPRSIVEGSLALGADAWQTLWWAVIPAARSGLFAAIMLGMGRAIGETMTVLMATGNAVALPGSVVDPVRTMTATIAIELGEVARGTTHYHMLFAVGLVLFLSTLLVNLLAEWVQRRGEG